MPLFAVIPPFLGGELARLTRKEKIMKIINTRINSLIEKFFNVIVENGLTSFKEYLSYPGGIVWITEKQYEKSIKREKQITLAYIRKIIEHGNTAGACDIPLFKIVLIKERVLNLTDDEFLHLLAHECSHIFFQARKNPYEEYACDILAENFFGFKKPTGSTEGYIHDKEAFIKIYGEKKYKEFFPED